MINEIDMEALRILHSGVLKKFFKFRHGKLWEFIVCDPWKGFSLYGAISDRSMAIYMLMWLQYSQVAWNLETVAVFETCRVSEMTTSNYWDMGNDKYYLFKIYKSRINTTKIKFFTKN